jgi:hypothetical protein
MPKDTQSQVTQWLVFSIALSLAPIVLLAIVQIAHGQALTLASLLDNGDLFIISAVLAADGIGTAITAARHNVLTPIGAGGCVLGILWASAWDVLIKTQQVTPIYPLSTIELITFAGVLFSLILCRFRQGDKK